MDFKRPATSILRHPRWRWVVVFIACELVTFMGLVHLTLGGHLAWIGLAAVCFLSPGMAVSLINLIQPKVSTKPKDRYEVRRSYWNSLAYIFLGFGWAAGSYLLVLNRPESAVLAWPLMYLCIFIAVVATLQLADRRPLMIIDQSGVRSRDFGDKLVPWNEVTGARIENLGGAETLVLELREPDKFITPSKLGGAFSNAVNLEMASLGLVKVESSRLEEVLDFVLSQCDICPPNRYQSLIGAVKDGSKDLPAKKSDEPGAPGVPN